MQVWSLGQEDPLEKATAPHSNILAWRIPWTEEPGELQSTASQRVGYDWSNLARMHTWGTHLPSFLTFPLASNAKGPYNGGQATSCVVVRGSASMMISVGHCQLLMASHCTPHLQSSHLLWKISWTTTTLYICRQFPRQMCCWCCKLSLLL